MSAIALAVTVLLASLIIGGSVTRVQAALGRESGEPTFAIVPVDGDLDERLIAKIWKIDGVHDVTPRLGGTVVIGRTPVSLIGIDVLRPFADGSVRGDAPGSFDARGRFIDRGPLVLGRNAIISASFARNHHFKVGALLHVRVGATTTDLRVAAIRSEPSALSSKNVVIVDIGIAQTIMQRIERLDRIDCVVDPARRESLMRALSAIAGVHARVVEAIDPRTAYRSAFAVLSDDARLISVLVFLASMLIVYDAIAASVAARRAEIGTLRALGALRGTIFRCFIAEAAIVGGCGAVFGLGLGIQVAATMVNGALVGVINADVTVLLSVLFDDPRTIAGVFLLTVAATVVAALVPAFAAASVSPALAYGMRGSPLPLHGRGVLVRRIACVGGALILIVLLAVAQHSMMTGGIEGVALVAVLLLVRQLVPIIGRSGGGTVSRVALRLAAANLERFSARTMLAATAVVVAVTVAAQTIVIRASTRVALAGSANELSGVVALELRLATLTVAVAVVATASSFIAQAVERGDEFRSYRRLGLVLRALRGMVAFEGAVVGSVSAIAGCLIGVLFAEMIGVRVGIPALSPTAFPTGSLALLVLGATTISASAALAAANRIR